MSFDPELDDTQWTERWCSIPVVQVPSGACVGGYRIAHRAIGEAMVFGRPFRLAEPMECSFLYGPDGRLWMSDTPQERIMMYNNGRHSWGHVLVGGLGLGLYPQYAAIGAAGEATRFTVIERSQAVCDLVVPVLRKALCVPVEATVGDVEGYLGGVAQIRYDTVFLDTWETLDAARLPWVNRLRELALGHLSPDGRVLLWGYRWMVRLYEDACRHLLAVAPEKRRAWLASRAEASPGAVRLLAPVLDRFEGQPVRDMEAATAWCRSFITRVTASG